MTNGDKIIEILKPKDYQIKIYTDWIEIEIQPLGINFSCDIKWWGSPYTESEVQDADSN